MNRYRTGLALSIQQPWAWLIVSGHKDVENRTWPTRVRGMIGVHAGKAIDHEGLTFVRQRFPHIELPDTFETGGIVGVTRILDCVEELDSPWFFGPYGFRLDPSFSRPLPFRACRGRLGFFRPELGPPSPDAGLRTDGV